MKSAPVAVVLLVLALGACAPPVQEPEAVSAEDDLVTAVMEWRERRDASLRKTDGWLTLVGLHWLKEGDNAFGTGEANDIVLAGADIGEYGGVLVREGRQVTLLRGAGTALFIDGTPVSGAADLAADTSGDPTIVESGSLSFYVLERGDLIGIRVKDSESAVLAQFEGMEYFPVDANWRVIARYELFDEPRILRTPNVLGTVTEEEIRGEVVFEHGGDRHTLLPSGDPAEGFFLVFGDKTNAIETYGGGRFLYTDAVADDGSVVVDFNKAYSPPCVFTPYATCPLPPPENKLSIRIEAGEKTFGSVH